MNHLDGPLIHNAGANWTMQTSQTLTPCFKMALHMLDRDYDEVSANRLTSKQAFNSEMQVVLIFNMWKRYKPDTNLANVKYNNRLRGSNGR